jgi:hypothetical protein
MKIKANSKSKLIMNKIPIGEYLSELNNTHIEVKKLNNNYWSLFSLIYCSAFIIMNSLILFILFFNNFNLIMKNIFIYALVITLFLVTIIFYSASSVSFEANTTYKLINTYYLTNINSFTFSNKIKVNLKKNI